MQLVTITDVAQAAGVSITTVSRAINNSFMVSEARRNRIFEAMRKLGYQPALREGKSRGEIVLLVFSVAGLMEDVLSGIYRYIKQTNAVYQIALSFTGLNTAGYRNALTLLKTFPRKQVCGVIMINNVCDDPELWAGFQQYPVVQIGEYIDGDSCFAVTTDDRHAMAELTRLIIAKGRRKFAFVSNKYGAVNRQYHFCVEREAGFRDALRETGIPFNEELLLYSDLTSEGGMELARHIAGMENRPDAVICTTDRVAAGCIGELRELGVAVPGEIAVTGFNDAELAEFCCPKLTTVRQSFDEMGVEAMRMMDALISGSARSGRITYIKHSIMERDSA